MVKSGDEVSSLDGSSSIVVTAAGNWSVAMVLRILVVETDPAEGSSHAIILFSLIDCTVSVASVQVMVTSIFARYCSSEVVGVLLISHARV